MVKKTVISVCPEVHSPSPSLLSMAVGFSPARRLIPTLSSVGFWLSGFSRGWREVAGGAGEGGVEVGGAGGRCTQGSSLL